MSIDPLAGLATTDPTGATSTSSGSTTNPTSTANPNPLGENAFLNLLVTQLKNQDPLQPLSDSDFIAQLAQFSSLEQLQGIKGDLDSFMGGLQSLATAPADASTTPSTSSPTTSPVTPATEGSN